MSLETSFVRIVLFAAIIAALGLLPKFSLPIAGGVPITAQSLGIMLAGAVLGPWRGTLATLLFLLVVALGAPLLAGGRGGLGVFFAPSAGFLIGFAPAAAATGLLTGFMRRFGAFRAALAASIGGGIVVLYLFGVLGLAALTNLSLTGAAAAVLVFIPGDIAKALLAAFIVRALVRARPGYVAALSRS